jgi:hypothetical protein
LIYKQEGLLYMRRTGNGRIPSNSAAVTALVGHIHLVGIGRVLMTPNTKVLGFKEHKVIYAANGVIEGVMAVGTGSLCTVTRFPWPLSAVYTHRELYTCNSSKDAGSVITVGRISVGIGHGHIWTIQDPNKG